MYLPFPRPLTGSIKPAFFSFLINSPAGETVIPTICDISVRPNICSKPTTLNNSITFVFVALVTFSALTRPLTACFFCQSPVSDISIA